MYRAISRQIKIKRNNNNNNNIKILEIFRRNVCGMAWSYNIVRYGMKL